MPAKKNKARPAPAPPKTKSLKKVSGGTGILPGDQPHDRRGTAIGSEVSPFSATGVSRPRATN